MAEIETGTDCIRAALRARRPNLAGMARDIGISATALDAFANGTTRLSIDSLKSLTAILWSGHVEYDPVADRLKSIGQPPRSMGVCPPTLTDLPKYQAGPGQMGPQPVDDSPAAKPKKRAGWLNSWL